MGEVTPVGAKECDAPVDTHMSDVPEVCTPVNSCRGGGTAPYTFEEEILSYKKHSENIC